MSTLKSIFSQEPRSKMEKFIKSNRDIEIFGSRIDELQCLITDIMENRQETDCIYQDDKIIHFTGIKDIPRGQSNYPSRFSSGRSRYEPISSRDSRYNVRRTPALTFSYNFKTNELIANFNYDYPLRDEDIYSSDSDTALFLRAINDGHIDLNNELTDVLKNAFPSEEKVKVNIISMELIHGIFTVTNQ